MTENGEVIIQNADLATEQKLTQIATKRALSDPLPGALADAFIKGPIKIGEYSVRPMVPSTFVFLKAIESPLIGMIQDVVSLGEIDTELSFEQSWELCWIFTHSAKECRESLENIKQLSIDQVGDVEGYPVQLVTTAVFEQVRRHMATAVKQAAEAQESGELRFFLDSVTAQATG